MSITSKRIGIIGQGYVGTAIKLGFEKDFNVNTFDKYFDKKSTHNSIQELVDSSDIIFLCLPTPMKKDGACYLGILEDVLSEINLLNFTSNKIIIIKSTIPPGTTDIFLSKYQNLNIIYNPEFLREANFIEDFKNQKFIILGGNENVINVVEEIYSIVFKEIKIVRTQPKISEMTKNMINTFLATKVSFANEIKQLCDKIGVNYDDVIKMAKNDERIGVSHWEVPGPDSKLGFGGSCFPKDINSLSKFFKDLNVDCDVIDAAIKTNEKVRPEKDWEQLEGRAVINEE